VILKWVIVALMVFMLVTTLEVLTTFGGTCVIDWTWGFDECLTERSGP
jgi:hypothetical protein